VKREQASSSAGVSSDTSPPPLAQWLDALEERFRSGAELALAEARLAVSSFMLMIFLSILAAGALLIAWALLLFAIAQLPIAMGLSKVSATLILVGAHVIVAWLLWRSANALGNKMDLPETRRLLRSTARSAVEEAERHGR
jgi:hypothetical protein